MPGGSLSSFEFIMVLVSIIMGLGITTLLSGAVNALRADSPTRAGLIHGAWVIALLNFHVSTWLIRWRASGRTEWTGLEVLVFLLVPILLFAAAKLAFPPESSDADLSAYLLENRRPFFGLLWLMSLGTAFGPFLFYDPTQFSLAGVSLSPALATATGILNLVVFGLLAWSSNRKLHAAFAIYISLSSFFSVINPLVVLSD